MTTMIATSGHYHNQRVPPQGTTTTKGATSRHHHHNQGGHLRAPPQPRGATSGYHHNQGCHLRAPPQPRGLLQGTTTTKGATSRQPPQQRVPNSGYHRNHTCHLKAPPLNTSATSGHHYNYRHHLRALPLNTSATSGHHLRAPPQLQMPLQGTNTTPSPVPPGSTTTATALCNLMAPWEPTPLHHCTALWPPPEGTQRATSNALTWSATRTPTQAQPQYHNDHHECPLWRSHWLLWLCSPIPRQPPPQCHHWGPATSLHNSAQISTISWFLFRLTPRFFHKRLGSEEDRCTLRGSYSLSLLVVNSWINPEMGRVLSSQACYLKVQRDLAALVGRTGAPLEAQLEVLPRVLSFPGPTATYSPSQYARISLVKLTHHFRGCLLVWGWKVGCTRPPWPPP